MSAIINSPHVIVSELGLLGTILSGVVLAFSAGMAALGVASGRYRWEWVSAWVSALALMPYAVTVWALVIIGLSDNQTLAFLATSLLGFYVTRGFLCAAHAAKLREAHLAATQVIDSMNGDDEGDSDGDGRAGGG